MSDTRSSCSEGSGDGSEEVICDAAIGHLAFERHIDPHDAACNQDPDVLEAVSITAGMEAPALPNIQPVGSSQAAMVAPKRSL